MRNWIPWFFVDVINQPCLKLSVGLANHNSATETSELHVPPIPNLWGCTLWSGGGILAYAILELGQNYSSWDSLPDSTKFIINQVLWLKKKPCISASLIPGQQWIWNNCLICQTSLFWLIVWWIRDRFYFIMCFFYLKSFSVVGGLAKLSLGLSMWEDG